MIKKNRFGVAFTALTCVFWCSVSEAGNKGVYNCADNSLATQQLYLNVGNANRRLRLSIPVHTSGHSQHDVDSIQHCLYKNKLLTPEQTTAYVHAYTKCRAQYYENKIQVTRASDNKRTYSTKKPQNLNHCMSLELLEDNETEE